MLNSGKLMARRGIRDVLKAVANVGVLLLVLVWGCNQFRVSPKTGPGPSDSKSESIARGVYIADIRADREWIVPWGGRLNLNRGWIEEVMTIRESSFWGPYESRAGYYRIIIPLDDSEGFSENTESDYLSFSLVEQPGCNTGIHRCGWNQSIFLHLSKIPANRTVRLRISNPSWLLGEYELHFDSD